MAGRMNGDRSVSLSVLCTMTADCLLSLPFRHRPLTVPRAKRSQSRPSTVRNLCHQLRDRELGLRRISISRQHINSFRRSLTSNSPLSASQESSLEFLRAVFCCTHLQASFQRLISSPGDSLSQQVETFLKMLKEPCPDEGTGFELRSFVRKRAAFFDHLWSLGIAQLVVRLLMMDSNVSNDLFVRNKALCLRLIRRLGRRSLRNFGPKLMSALAEDVDFLHFCLQLAAHPRLVEETVTLMEDVFHYRREELSLQPFMDVLPRMLMLVSKPHLKAKVMRLLVLMCAPIRANEQLWPADDFRCLVPTGIASDNQRMLLRDVPDFLSQLLDVLDAGVMGSLPRSRHSLSLDEEAHWFDWLDAEDAVRHRSELPLVRAAVSKVVAVVDVMESAMLLRMLLVGPHSAAVRQTLLNRLDIGTRLCRYMDKLLWNDSDLSLHTEGLMETIDLRPETPLKLQIVRCISALFESCSPTEKRLFHSKQELCQLRILTDLLPAHERDASLYDVNPSNCCRGSSGLLTRLSFALMQQPKLSNFRLWLSKCIESYLLDLARPQVDQQFLALIELPSLTSDRHSTTLLEDQINQSFLNTKFTIADTVHVQDSNGASSLHKDLRVQACDTLATLTKGNKATSCLLLTGVWNAVRRASDVSFYLAINLLQEELASVVLMTYFRHYSVISNVLLRAFAVTELANDVKGPSINVVSKCLPEMVYSLLKAVEPSAINQGNVSCLNTVLVIFVLKYRHHALADFLVELQAHCVRLRQDLDVFRVWLQKLLAAWSSVYLSRTPSCLNYLASTWGVDEAQLRRVVGLVLDDLHSGSFPFIDATALVALLEKRRVD